MKRSRSCVRWAVSSVAALSVVVMVAVTPAVVSAQPAAVPSGSGSVDGSSGLTEAPGEGAGPAVLPVGPGTSVPAVPLPADAEPPAGRQFVPTSGDQRVWDRRPPVERARVNPPARKFVPTVDPKSVVTPGQMRSDREELPEGFTKADADKAETMEAALVAPAGAGGFRTVAAPGCQVYWPAPYEVCGRIRDKYNSMGGPNSFLLWPKTNELTNPDGYGKRTEFQNGPIYWSPQGDAHPVVNHFLAAWARQGYESNYIGYPTTDEIVNPDGIGRRQHFTGATIYWRLNEAYSVGGAIADKWNSLGAERADGLLGYPVSDEEKLPDGVGRMNRFERGVIYWHPSTGAQEIIDPILRSWSSKGFERSLFGYPTGPERFTENGRLVQNFQNGTLDLTHEFTLAGSEQFVGKDVNTLLMDYLRSYALVSGIDLDDFIETQSVSNLTIASRAAPGSAPYPNNPNDGGVTIPSSYYYSGRTGDALNDFCTSSPDELPTYGARANFRGACARHDMCYAPAKDNPYKPKREEAFRICDTKFFRDLRTVCDGVYRKYDPRWSSCTRMAAVYYNAVVVKHWYNYL